ncbi:hypothetical protein PG988_002288 [Apiospora saccharicola]
MSIIQHNSNVANGQEAGHNVERGPQEAADTIDAVNGSISAVGKPKDFLGQAVESRVLGQLGQLSRRFTHLLADITSLLLARRGGRTRGSLLLFGRGLVNGLGVISALELVLELGLETGRDRGLGRAAGRAGARRNLARVRLKTPGGAAMGHATAEDVQEAFGLGTLDLSDSGERAVGDTVKLSREYHIGAAFTARQEVLVQQAQGGAQVGGQTLREVFGALNFGRLGHKGNASQDRLLPGRVGRLTKNVVVLAVGGRAGLDVPGGDLDHLAQAGGHADKFARLKVAAFGVEGGSLDRGRLLSLVGVSHVDDNVCSLCSKC